MRILIATDAWHPQINGVVRTLSALVPMVERRGATVRMLTPEGMPTLGLPSYRSIRLALPTPRRIAREIEAFRPDAIHVVTEGTIGHFVRSYCLSRARLFTTSFHTRFADYAAARWPIPDGWIWAWLRRFHNAGRLVMAPTPSLADELTSRGFRAVALWPRGVDTAAFRPRAVSLPWPKPIFLSVGRLAVEKNLDAFLSLDLPGTKLVVGDGPAAADLAHRFPDAVFLGARQGEALAEIYAGADAFVFPSRTDTFGLVLLEALASGVPVAGFPVAATADVIAGAPVGVLDEDLRSACLRALTLSPADCRRHALAMSWQRSADCFLANVERANAGAWAKAGRTRQHPRDLGAVSIPQVGGDPRAPQPG